MWQSNIDVSWKATQNPGFEAPRPNKCCDSGYPGSNISLRVRKSPTFQWWHLLNYLGGTVIYCNPHFFAQIHSFCRFFGHIVLRDPLKIRNVFVHQSPNLMIFPLFPFVTLYLPPFSTGTRLTATACRSSNFRSRASVEDSGLNCNLQERGVTCGCLNRL